MKFAEQKKTTSDISLLFHTTCTLCNLIRLLLTADYLLGQPLPIPAKVGVDGDAVGGVAHRPRDLGEQKGGGNIANDLYVHNQGKYCKNKVDLLKVFSKKFLFCLTWTQSKPRVLVLLFPAP